MSGKTTIGPTGGLARAVGVAMIALGVLEIAIFVWGRVAWTNLAPPGAAYPPLSWSPNPLAAWLQSVTIGAILTVKGAKILARRDEFIRDLVFGVASALLVLASMVVFSLHGFNLALVLLLLAIAFFVV